MDCSVTQARELIGNAKLWPKVKAYLAAGGEFELFPAGDPRSEEHTSELQSPR